jgi:serine/threonine protein kinase
MSLPNLSAVDYAEEAFEKCNECCCERLQMKSEIKLFTSGSLEDSYEVGELLGNGGYGIVYAGIRKKDKMKVAIKHIAKGKVTGMEMVDI